MDAREYLVSILYTRKEMDDWLADKAFPRAEKYDGQLGWLEPGGHFKEGIDGSVCTYSYDESGARRMIMHTDKGCRINTYGNSFTNCAQVSDGETWQEILAAHLGEPIRNFGVGGYSVYQTYLRMKREEMRTPAEYILFGIYDDDHFRSLTGWRNIRSGYTLQFRGRGGRGLSPTLPHVKVNPVTEEFVECENPCPTPESCYNLCDLEWVYETFKDDFVLKIMLAHANLVDKNYERSYADIMDLAATYGIEMQIENSETAIKTLDTMYTRAAIFASMRIIEKVEKFASANGKKVLYVLSFGSSNIAKRVQKGYRFDQEFVDFLRRKGLPYIDLMEVHLADFAQFKTSIEDYLKRYYIDHYNPLGNFFQAFAIKDKLVEILEPKPISYKSNPDTSTSGGSG